MRCHSASVIERSASFKSPIVAALAEVEISDGLACQPHLVGGARQPHDRLGMVPARSSEQHGDAERGGGDRHHVVTDLAQRAAKARLSRISIRAAPACSAAPARRRSHQATVAMLGRGVEAPERLPPGEIAHRRHAAFGIFREAVGATAGGRSSRRSVLSSGSTASGARWRQWYDVDATGLAQHRRVAKQVAGLAEQTGAHAGRKDQPSEERRAASASGG
jgi:hypothetical protein